MTWDPAPGPKPEPAPVGIVERADVEWRRRLMIFGESIRSDMDNPLATTWRSIMRALTRAGHEVVFVEPRRSESLSRMLRHRGSTPLRLFADAYPDVQYRTLDLPRGRELRLWLARELALVDAVVVLDNASDALKDLIAAYDEPRLLRVRAAAPGAGLLADGEPIDLGPAIDLQGIEPQPVADPDRPRIAVLAWDAEQAGPATRAWHTVSQIDAEATRLSLGSLELDGWRPITECELAPALSATDIAVVITGLHPAGPALGVRALLPWSFGVRAIALGTERDDPGTSLPAHTVDLDGLADQIRELARTDWPDLTPWSASLRAAALIAAIDRCRGALRAARS